MRVTEIDRRESKMHAFKSLPEGTRVELIDNEFYFMSPSPRESHQDILGRLFRRIGNFVEANDLGRVYVAPFDVYLDEEFNAVQPDVMFISSNGGAILHDDGIHGSPDLIIEVLSPSNRSHDFLVKRRLYDIFGVREYVIVDPVTKTTTQFILSNDRFDTAVKNSGDFHSHVLNSSFSF